MARIFPVVAALAGIAFIVMPVQAQMGATGGGMSSNPGGATSSGTMAPAGSMTNQGNMQGNIGGQGNMRGGMGMQGNGQGSMGGRMMRGEAGERQMTECLNMAAAQQQPLTSCRQ